MFRSVLENAPKIFFVVCFVIKKLKKKKKNHDLTSYNLGTNPTKSTPSTTQKPRSGRNKKNIKKRTRSITNPDQGAQKTKNKNQIDISIITIPDRHRSLCHDVRQTKGSVVNSHSWWWQIVRSFIMWSRLNHSMPMKLDHGQHRHLQFLCIQWLSSLKLKREKVRAVGFPVWDNQREVCEPNNLENVLKKIPIKHSTNFYKGFSDQWKFFTMKRTPENEESAFW